MRLFLCSFWSNRYIVTEKNIMSDYPNVGSFSQNEINRLAVKKYLDLKAAGKLKPCS